MACCFVKGRLQSAKKSGLLKNQGSHCWESPPENAGILFWGMPVQGIVLSKVLKNAHLLSNLIRTFRLLQTPKQGPYDYDAMILARSG